MNRIPKAIATITTSAPKSGSSSSRPPMTTIHDEQRQETPERVCLSGCLPCRDAALRTA